MKARIFQTFLLLFLAAVSGAQAQTVEPLTLRVNDAVAAPGELAAVVVRTYASRPIRQGQICFLTILRSALPGPFTGIESARVFSVEDDAWQNALIETGNPDAPVLVRFASPTASINAADGPLLVVYLRLREDLVPGTEYELHVDPANTIMLDSSGQPIATVPRAGRLTVAHPGAALEASIDSDYVRPELVTLSLQTNQIRALSGGQIGLQYPMRVMPGPPYAFVDARYGQASVQTTWAPGLLVVTFDSPDHSLNTLPGDILSITVKTRAPSNHGSVPLILDPAFTFLRDSQGAIVPITIENGVLEFE